MPVAAKPGVMLAYAYYIRLFEKIRKVPVDRIKEARIRVSDIHKVLMLIETLTKQQLGLLHPELG